MQIVVQGESFDVAMVHRLPHDRVLLADRRTHVMYLTPDCRAETLAGIVHELEQHIILHPRNHLAGRRTPDAR